MSETNLDIMIKSNHKKIMNDEIEIFTLKIKRELSFFW